MSTTTTSEGPDKILANKSKIELKIGETIRTSPSASSSSHPTEEEGKGEFMEFMANIGEQKVA